MEKGLQFQWWKTLSQVTWMLSPLFFPYLCKSLHFFPHCQQSTILTSQQAPFFLQLCDYWLCVLGQELFWELNTSHLLSYERQILCIPGWRSQQKKVSVPLQSHVWLHKGFASGNSPWSRSKPIDHIQGHRHSISRHLCHILVMRRLALRLKVSECYSFESSATMWN